MNSNQIASTIFWIVIGMVLGTGSVRADESFRDEFRDSNPTNSDREPVTWKNVPGFPNDIMIENENLLIGQDSGDPALAVVDQVDFTAQDVAIESQFHIQEGTNAGLYIRINSAEDDCYFGHIAASTHPFPLRAGILRCVTNETVGTLVPVDFDASEEDVVMRLEAVGDEMKLWAWPADETRPDQPLVTASDIQLTGSGVGVLADDLGSTLTRAEFRYFEAVVIPEPSMAVLSAFGLLGLLAWGRQNPSGH